MSKMKPASKKVFVDALRSGEYKQIRGNLALCRGRDDWSFCALGVAANELCEGDWESREIAPETIGVASYYILHMFDCLNQHGLDEHTRNAIIVMNDSQGKSFDSIADWVEANL